MAGDYTRTTSLDNCEDPRRLPRPRPGKRQSTLCLATWNVRTWNSPEASQITLNECKKYNINVAAIQEHRWRGSGSVRLNGGIAYYSGADDWCRAGVGFVVDLQTNKSIITFNAISERICYLRLRGGSYNLSLISAYAPTEDADMEIKDDFYELLNLVYNSMPKYDAKLILGDMNAKVGKEIHYRPTIGLHSLHNLCNRNGERLVNFASSNGMIIASTTFDHKRIHKYTWLSADGITKNQIDHVLVDNRHKSGVVDVRTLRGADCGSDHCLVRAFFIFKVKKVRPDKNSKSNLKWDLNPLRDYEIREDFKTQVKAKLDALPDPDISESNNVDVVWMDIESALRDSAKICLGKANRDKTTDWFDDSCRLAVERRKSQRLEWLVFGTEIRYQSFLSAARETRRILRATKRRFMCQRIADLDVLRNNPKLFYKRINEISGPSRPMVMTLLDQNGASVTDTSQMLTIWKNYFSNLLNSRSQEVTEVNEINIINNTEVQSPSLGEIELCIRGLRGGKAAGEDALPADLFKYGGRVLARKMHELIQLVWQNEVMPTGWNTAVVCPIHKKGDMRVCTNFRGISLLNGAYKLFAKVLLGRLAGFADSLVGDYQCGFRPGRSTIDQIFNVKQYADKSWERGIDTHHIFVDFRQAYDSIDRSQLWHAMRNLGIPEKLVSLTRMCVSGSVSRVRLQGELSEPFVVSTGVRQGDALSPLLFNIALEGIMRKIEKSGRADPWEDECLMLAYADDVDIVGRTEQGVVEAFRSFSGAAARVGLDVNWDKTKYLVMSRPGRTRSASVRVLNHAIESVPEFKYLGCILTEDNRESREISARIQSANRSAHALKKLVGSRLLSRANKLLIYKTLIRPIAVYGAETWTMTVQDMQRLDRFERKILRRIFGPCRAPAPDHFRIRSNAEVMAMYNDVPLTSFIKIQRLRWAGHVARMDDSRLPGVILASEPPGRRPVGRPRLRWGDRVRADAERLGLSDWTVEAQDRRKWRSTLAVARTLIGPSAI